MRAKRKINVLELTERGAELEMSNEIESDRAMGVKLEFLEPMVLL